MEEQFREFLKKYADGKATAKERAVVDDFFETLQKGGVSAEDSSRDPFLTHRLDEGVYAKTIYRRRMWQRTLLAAAASVLVIFSVAVFLYIRPTHVHTTTVMAQKGKQLKVTLPDSSIAYLNSESSLTYPDDMDGGDRHIKLSGEAYFEVAHDASRPFIVESGAMTTRVLGTRFVVHDYAGEVPSVIVRSGKVGVAVPGMEPMTVLEKDDRVIYTDGMAMVDHVNAQDYYSWKDGSIVFDQANLQQVIHTLNRRFNVKIMLTSEFSAKCTITGSYYDQNIQDILKSLRFIYGIDYTVDKDGAIYLTTKPC